jgi:hypothetical protein
LNVPDEVQISAESEILLKKLCQQAIVITSELFMFPKAQVYEVPVKFMT